VNEALLVDRRMLSTLRTICVRHPDRTVFLFALAVRVAWVLTLADAITWYDEREFAAIARHLAAGDGYVSSSFRANPTLPVYLALWFRAVGEHFLLARLGQSLIGAATCVVIRRTGALVAGPAAGLLGGLLLAVYPLHIYAAGVFYVDCWLTFFLSLTVYLTVQVAQGQGGIGRGLLTGAALGLTALTRPALLVFLPGPPLTWMIGTTGSRGRRALLCAAFVVGCAATVLPWTYRNYQVYGRPLLVSSGFGAMLWRGNHELSTGGPDDRLLDWGSPLWQARVEQQPADRRRALDEEHRRLDQLLAERQRTVADTELAMDDVLGPIAVKTIAGHPGRSLWLALTKVVIFFSAFSDTRSGPERIGLLEQRVAALSFYPVLGLALLGLAAGWRHDFTPLLLLIALVTAGYSALTTCTRFRLPLDPFLIVVAAFVLVRVATRIRAALAAPARGAVAAPVTTVDAAVPHRSRPAS
jgi:4-amino-4-deoxy-L-arabinose transferase-like glycosyltransferase